MTDMKLRNTVGGTLPKSGKAFLCYDTSVQKNRIAATSPKATDNRVSH
jgi:hypothetical protein